MPWVFGAGVGIPTEGILIEISGFPRLVEFELSVSNGNKDSEGVPSVGIPPANIKN